MEVRLDSWNSSASCMLVSTIIKQLNVFFSFSRLVHENGRILRFGISVIFYVCPAWNNNDLYLLGILKSQMWYVTNLLVFNWACTQLKKLYPVAYSIIIRLSKMKFPRPYFLLLIITLLIVKINIGTNDSPLKAHPRGTPSLYSFFCLRLVSDVS